MKPTFSIKVLFALLMVTAVVVSAVTGLRRVITTPREIASFQTAESVRISFSESFQFDDPYLEYDYEVQSPTGICIRGKTDPISVQKRTRADIYSVEDSSYYVVYTLRARSPEEWGFWIETLLLVEKSGLRVIGFDKTNEPKIVNLIKQNHPDLLLDR